MSNTIRVKFVRETFVSGDRFNVDDVADIQSDHARQLILTQRAERCDLTDEEIEATHRAAMAEAEATAKAKAQADAKAAAEAAAKAKADAEAAAKAKGKKDDEE